jgi:hypothetical protein
VPWRRPLPHGRGSKRACRVLGACRALRFPPPSRSGLQKSVSCLGSLSCFGNSPSLTVGAPKERVVSGVLVVPCDSPLPHGRGSKRACRVQGACRAWGFPLPYGRGSKRACRVQGVCRALGFPPPSRSGLQKSLACTGSLSCLGIPPSLTVGAPKELGVYRELVVLGDSPSLTVGAPKERVVSGKLVVSCELVVPCDSPLPYGRGSKRACRVWGACRALRFPPP